MDRSIEPVQVHNIRIHVYKPIPSRDKDYVYAEWTFPFKHYSGSYAHSIVRYNKSLAALVYSDSLSNTIVTNPSSRLIDPSITNISAKIQYNVGGYYNATDVVFYCGHYDNNACI